jgi:hypothetical protein
MWMFKKIPSFIVAGGFGLFPNYVPGRGEKQ